MNEYALWNYVKNQSNLVLEWAKCGESTLSSAPTFLWAIGSAALAQRLITAVFRRFMFRRVPLWEVLLQYLLYIWMVVYSLHFWVFIVKMVKLAIVYCYEMDATTSTAEEIESCKLMQQWMIWMCGLTPLALFIHMRPKSTGPPVMIWITTNPWHRREMGPYGYYLNRPPSLQASYDGSPPATLPLRRAFSDSKTIVFKEQHKKKRTSKSV